ncbi:DUF6850 family outer membrane beta-barrel protein [Porphyromonas sp.]|uniref:DUF6850 family outer membrane beta-barrel protein n=1 Tax=Porphyromonas sp. TaxID=1924944 RepID=UPI0026DCF664|nr:DUF6850 family outer membrane beta-barrel protein [Porphyromonas sp.]MDO4771177.1 hypothetical protein [Porphyromonas sp.]
MTNKILYIISLLSLSGLLSSAVAQKKGDTPNTPTAYETGKIYLPWLRSDNAAGLPFDDQRYSGAATIRSEYALTKGAFKDPQDGHKIKQLSVFSEGHANFENVYTYGSFEYSDLSITDAGYNASILDPHRGMPYYIADTYQSNWRKHNYKLQFKASTRPLFDFVTFGLTGRYSALHGAKQRDPRTDNRLMQLELIPSTVFLFGENHKVGISAGYGVLKEQSHMQNLNASESHDYYTLLGLGKSIKHIGSGETSDYKGIKLSGDAYYFTTIGDLKLMLSGGYSRHTETATISFSTPHNRGSILSDHLHSSLELAWEKASTLHQLTAFGEYSKTQGIEYINIRDNSTEQKGWIQLHRDVRSEYKDTRLGAAYTLLIRRGMGYDWKFGLSTRLEDTDNSYLVPSSTYLVRNVVSGLDVAKSFVLSQAYNSELLLQFGGSYGHNLKGRYEYNDSHPESPMVKDLEQGRLDYQSSDYTTLGGSITYSSQVTKTNTSILFAKLGYEHTAAKTSALGKRGVLSVSIGYNF